MDFTGLNSEMNELSAIVGLENLKNIKKLNLSRKKVISKYLKFFLAERQGYVSLMKINKNVFCNFFSFFQLF